jgi:folate-binding protein YgfZ
VPRELATAVAGSLRRFVLRAKVDLQVATDLQVAWVARTLTPIPESAATEIVSFDYAPGRQVIAAPSATLRAMAGPSHERAHPEIENEWRAADLSAGLPQVYAASSGSFVPQMLNLDRLDAISFSKGCYTGQEIIARTHYKGGVKRHLHRLIGRGEPPPPGSALERDGQSAGTVVGSACSGEGRCDILAVVSDELASAGAHVVLLAGGSEFHLPA